MYITTLVMFLLITKHGLQLKSDLSSVPYIALAFQTVPAGRRGCVPSESGTKEKDIADNHRGTECSYEWGECYPTVYHLRSIALVNVLATRILDEARPFL